MTREWFLIGLGGGLLQIWPMQAEEASTASIGDAISQLESDRFEARERALLDLWRLGEAALPGLESAVQSKDPEVRMRAQRILEAFRLGILPDTPAAELAIIFDFHRGDSRDKERVVTDLCRRGDLKLVQRLIRTLEPGPLQSNLVGIASESLKRSLFPLLMARNYEKARETLAWIAIDDDGMRDYACFVALTDQVSLALQEVASADGPAPSDWRIEGWIHRAIGTMDSAVELGRTHGDERWVLSVHAAAGDPAAYCRAYLLNEGLEEGERLGFELTLARLEEDSDRFAEKLRTLSQWAQRPENAVMARQAVQSFLINGEIEAALPLMGEDLRNSAFSMHTFRSVYGRARDAIGLKDLNPPFTNWTDRLVNEFGAGNFERFPRAMEVAGHLYGMGMETEGKRIYSLLFEAVRDDADRMKELLQEEALQGVKELAVDHLLTMKSEGMDMGILLSILGIGSEVVRSGGREVVGRWWEFLKETRSAEPEKAKLESLWDLLMHDPSGKNEKELRDLFEMAATHAEEGSDMEKLGWYTTLYVTAASHLMHDDALIYLERAASVVPNSRVLSLLGTLAADRGEWEKSLTHHKNAWEQHQKETGNGQLDPVLLYLYSRALSRGERQEEGSKMLELAKLLPLGDPGRRAELAASMLANGDHENAVEQWQLAARLSRVDDPGSSGGAPPTKEIFDGLAEALGYDAPRSAAMYKERALMETLSVRLGYLYYYTYYLRMRMQIDQLRALAFAEEDQPEKALNCVEEFFALAPGNASIGERLLPMLEQLGMEEKALAFYEQTRSHCVEAIRLYPNSAMAFNNLAWLDARSRRKLDEALKSAQHAVELRPATAAYLDTLAEVHFALGDRAKALEISRQAVALAPEDKELLGQFERFETAPLPERRP